MFCLSVCSHERPNLLGARSNSGQRYQRVTTYSVIGLRWLSPLRVCSSINLNQRDKGKIREFKLFGLFTVMYGIGRSRSRGRGREEPCKSKIRDAKLAIL